MPNKTIYVSEDDLPVYQQAQELAGGNLSAAITAALRKYVEIEQGREEGFEEIVVRVGPGSGRPQRFVGALLGEWSRSTSQSYEVIRVYRTPKSKFVVHKTKTEDWATDPEGEKWTRGWRGWVGNWSSNQSWGHTPKGATLNVAETLEELRKLLPSELYDMVLEMAEQPAIEDLDI